MVDRGILATLNLPSPQQLPMAKTKSRYVCSACGGEFAQIYGRCPDCGAWGTISEQVVAEPIKQLIHRKEKMLLRHASPFCCRRLLQMTMQG